ncbi:RDD family protein [Nocardiopsis terrae]|uniref:RDD family membrane protein YckC n=1 Tax=Nocardiopsis terrae TaxID=372655 RepID=A0ABR9HEI2_9ACTN|nr:RDD family protein [Nocardiopsis terrae]MBE1457316.1 putative RDD family membrane protein YckC [Nocardiopsis terrae]GHC91712.1 RDD family protein [Nocardiopsis terrae]
MSDESRSGASAATEDDFRYRGNRLGLPESGTGSVPGVIRRLVGLALDWGIAAMLVWVAVNLGLIGQELAAAAAAGGDEEALALSNFTALSTLVVFAAMNILLLTLFGTTIGRRIVGVGIAATGERSWPWFVSMTVRTVLLCLVIPAVVYDRDTRGLHDRAAGTVASRY